MLEADVVSWLSAVLAGLSVLLSAIYSRRSLAYSKNAERAADLANAHSGQANVLSANAWLDQYLCNVRLWADEASENIARAMHATSLAAPDQAREYYEVMVRLSASIDRGRWFFPNQWAEEVGVDKEPAYRGLRQPILDHLVGAYDVVRALSDWMGSAKRPDLVHHQRLFASEVQRVMNPRRRVEEVARINAQFAISEELTQPGGKDASRAASK
jgi:hypothetical protein